jgi:hypothetical protein
MSPVLDQKLAKPLYRGIAHGEADTLAASIAAVEAKAPASMQAELEGLRRRRERLKSELDELSRLLQNAQEWLGLTDAHFRDALSVSTTTTPTTTPTTLRAARRSRGACAGPSPSTTTSSPASSTRTAAAPRPSASPAPPADPPPTGARPDAAPADRPTRDRGVPPVVPHPPGRHDGARIGRMARPSPRRRLPMFGSHAGRALALAVICATAPAARADTLFDNGPVDPTEPVSFNYGSLEQSVVYDDFVLPDGGTATGFAWTGFEDGAGDYVSTLYEVIRGPDPQSGVVVASGDVVAARVPIVLPPIPGHVSLPAFEYTVDGLSIPLCAGETYWLSLSQVMTPGRSATAAVSHTSPLPGMWQRFFGSFIDLPDFDLAFSLQGAPGQPPGLACGADADGDGIPDADDRCPAENPGGRDADLDGCADRVADLPALVRSLGLPHGLENALEAKARNAAAAAARGQTRAAANLLAAFVHLVDAQRGKKLTPAQADLLTAFALNATADLP